MDAFWSLAAYTAADLNLIPNPANRYSVGDRTPGLRRDPDGGLTIHLQPESPGADQEANWLPTSPSDDWFVILRLYRPQPDSHRRRRGSVRPRSATARVPDQHTKPERSRP